MTESHVEPHTRARVGEMLRKCRVRAGLDLAEVAQCLHIRQPFLLAIEDGQFDALPAPVYAVGFIRAYAEHLGLDADEVVRQFRNEIVGLGTRAPLHFPLPVAEGNTPKGGVLLLGSLIAIAAYAGWYVTSTRTPEVAEIVSPVPERFTPGAGGAPLSASPSQERAHAELQGPAQALSSAGPPTNDRGVANSGPMSSRGIDTPVATATGTAPPPVEPAIRGSAVPAPNAAVSPHLATQTAKPSTLGNTSNGNMPVDASAAGSSTASTAMAAEPPGGGMPTTVDTTGRIMLRAKADSWVEVRDPQTNTLLAARLLKAGDVYRIPDRPGLKLVTGNAGGLVVMVDGEVVPPLGKEGVVRRGVPLDADALRRGTEGTQ